MNLATLFEESERTHSAFIDYSRIPNTETQPGKSLSNLLIYYTKLFDLGTLKMLMNSQKSSSTLFISRLVKSFKRLPSAKWSN
jgi:hypothetical protein